ncbi:MAG: hypothetical protein VR70_03945 [Rhodospirillaceae bacterium BRH_c57]|nr:MAG: hypothetical protein VR70_03945 [Rhodospirillaceae bacterium BRH_c57]
MADENINAGEARSLGIPANILVDFKSWDGKDVGELKTVWDAANASRVEAGLGTMPLTDIDVPDSHWYRGGEPSVPACLRHLDGWRLVSTVQGNVSDVAANAYDCS